MTDERVDAGGLRAALAKLGKPSPPDPTAYQIAAQIGPGFLGLSGTGSVALLVPLDAVPVAAGRRGGGFSLSPAPRVAFQHGGRRWEQPAATLECTGGDMLDCFLVLTVDIARRLSAATPVVTWQAVVDCVDEWQELLARRAIMTLDRQLGLWAELWMISTAAEADRLVAAWRGPERGATDFFLDGVGLEVKASRQSLLHHVSQRQVDAPVGDHEAYLVSVWLGIEPGHGRSLPELVDDALARVSDAPALLKQIALVGYSPVDREQYETGFVVLETPRWFRAEDVPRVRAADPGVSQLRYVVTLDPERALIGETATRLWHHFCRTDAPTGIGKAGLR